MNIKQAKKWLDDLPICLVHNINEQNGEYYVEIEFCSRLGEDVVETIWFNKLTKESIAHGFRECADNFDADEHAELYIGMRGTRGVPNVSIRQFLDDADEIGATLDEFAKEVEKGTFE